MHSPRVVGRYAMFDEIAGGGMRLLADAQIRATPRPDALSRPPPDPCHRYWRFEQGQWRLATIGGFHPVAPPQPANRAVAEKSPGKPSEKAAKKDAKPKEERQHKGQREVPRK